MLRRLAKVPVLTLARSVLVSNSQLQAITQLRFFKPFSPPFPRSRSSQQPQQQPSSTSPPQKQTTQRQSQDPLPSLQDVVSKGKLYPTDEDASRTLLKRSLDDCLGALRSAQGEAGNSPSQVADKKKRNSHLEQAHRRLQRVYLHYRRTTPEFFGHQDELFAAGLACENYQGILKRLDEMKQKQIALQMRHYEAAMYALVRNEEELPGATGPAGKKKRRKKNSDNLFYFFNMAKEQKLLTPGLWGLLFKACSLLSVPTMTFDLWWNDFLEHCDEFGGTAGWDAELQQVVVHAMEYCAAQQDVQRALRTWNFYTQQLPSLSPLSCSSLPVVVAMLDTVERMKFDGGLRRAVIGHLKSRGAAAERELATCDWDTIIRISGSLSVESAVALIQRRGRTEQEQQQKEEESSSLPSSSSGANVPFAVWFALFRRFARNHRVRDAEAMFNFIRSCFTLDSGKKSLLVVILMRMYATLIPKPDFDSALSVFVTHVLRNGGGGGRSDEPSIAPTAQHYNILIRCADSPQAVSHLYMEACSLNLKLDAATYTRVFNGLNGSTVQSMTKQLPIEYTASPLDARINIPVEADPHAAREVAQRRRGVTELADSTEP